MENSDHAVDLSEVDVVNVFFVSSDVPFGKSGRVCQLGDTVCGGDGTGDFSFLFSFSLSKLTSSSSSGASSEDELKWSQNDEGPVGGDGGRGAVATGTQNWEDGSSATLQRAAQAEARRTNPKLA